MTDLFSPTHELVALANRLGNHPARLALWNEGTVAAALPGGVIATTTAHASLAGLTLQDLVEYDRAKVQTLNTQEEVTEEELEDARAHGCEKNDAAPCADLFPYAELFAFEGVQFAAHTQPIPINQIICSPRARQFADRRNFPYEITSYGAASLLVPFAPPGPAMAKELKRKIALWQDRYKGTPKVILLQNHGMITLGESVEEVMMLTEMSLKYAEIFLGAAMMGGPEFLKPTHVSLIEATRMV